jgi:hypothetical protein
MGGTIRICGVLSRGNTQWPQQQGTQKKIPRVRVDCDNNGIVTNDNDPCNPLSTNQTQAKLLRVFKNLVANQPFSGKYKYVKAHADDTKRWRDCMLKERINIKVDGLGKKSLKAAMSMGKFIDSFFQNKQVWIEMGRKTYQHPQD